MAEARLIEVLGYGCAKCDLLYAHAEQAARELGIEYTIEKVANAARIARYGVMMTPALVVDGQVKLQGRVLSAEKLKELIA